MAKGKKDNKQANVAPAYNTLVRQLHEQGPERLYLLWGEEEYLVGQFLEELKRVSLEGDSGEFDCKCLEGPELPLEGLEQALDAIPFLSPYVFVVLRGVDINRCRETEAERAAQLLSDISDQTVVVITLPSGVQPDGRLKLTRAIKKCGQLLNFTVQGEDQLIRWIFRRFERLGKTTGPEEARQLIYVTGGLMNRLIPEIEKAAAHTNQPQVTMQDIDAVAHRLPEARVFELTDRLAERDYDAAAALLAQLLAMRDVEPIMLLAIIGQQFRRLYAARLALDEGLGASYLGQTVGVQHEFIAEKLMKSARGFPLGQLEAALVLCAETDYRMKSTPTPQTELLKELLLRIALEDRA